MFEICLQNLFFTFLEHYYAVYRVLHCVSAMILQIVHNNTDVQKYKCTKYRCSWTAKKFRFLNQIYILTILPLLAQAIHCRGVTS